MKRAAITLAILAGLLSGCATVKSSGPKESGAAPTAAKPDPAELLKQKPPQAVVATQTAPAHPSTELVWGNTKWKVFQPEVKQNIGAASKLTELDGHNSRDMYKELAAAPIARIPCLTDPVREAGNYASLLMMGMDPRSARGVIKLNHVIYTVSGPPREGTKSLDYNPVVWKNPDGTIDLLFWVRLCNGVATFALPRKEIKDGWWMRNYSALAVGVPENFRARITYPGPDALWFCTGTGLSDEHRCGRRWVGQYGEFLMLAARDTITRIFMRE